MVQFHIRAVVIALIFLLLVVFTLTPASAQIVNGHFDSNLNNWTCEGNLSCDRGSIGNYDGTYYARISADPISDPVTYTSLSQDVDVTGYSRVDLVSKGRIQESDHRGGYMRAYIGSNYEDLNEGWNEGLSWYEQSIPITGSGVQTFKLEVYTWWEDPESSAGVVIRIDNVELIPYSTLSGYVKDNYGYPIGPAYISLNNSGGSTESNDTGYYEITGLSDGTYSIMVTSGNNEDYSDTVSISADTEKNITLTRLSPVLTYTDSDTTVTDVFLFWKRNNVVDNVRIYKDTETRLLNTVGNGAYLSGMYNDKNLDCNKGYVYWLQPLDGSIAGPKYRIDAETDPCIDGGSGGTVPDPTPDLTPVVTPGPTVPPEINMTQEEWLNLTLEEKQDVLANITLMAPLDGLFSPLLEFKWEDVLVWGINLFLILCAVLALDSITTQKMSEYTGLIAIIPGGMFAYLGGYLVI